MMTSADGATAWVRSKYVFTCEALLPDLHLAYSSKTGALLEFGLSDWPTARTMLDAGWPAESVGSADEQAVHARLVANGLLVPSGTDELAQIRNARHVDHDSKTSRTLSLTIAPTMQCNFRCTYCFEEHRAEFMNEATVQALMTFITDKLDGETYTFTNVAVTWFGGEPLMAPKVIERVQTFIDEECGRRGIRCAKDIITNGYLLDDRMAKRLMALGEWGLVQVTVDGTPLVHDGRRPLVNGKATYDRVVQNASHAAELGLPVAVRMNIDSANSSIEQLRDSIVALARAGASNLVPRLYVSPVIDSTPECSHVSDRVLGRQKATAVRLRLAREFLRLGFRSGISTPSPRCVVCTADNLTGYCVAPTGLLFKCWNEIHMDESHAIGSLVPSRQVDPVVAKRNVDKWDGYDPFAKRDCVDCNALPACMGGCPWDAMRETDHGDCGEYKFAPRRVIQLTHADNAIAATGSDTCESSLCDCDGAGQAAES